MKKQQVPAVDRSITENSFILGPRLKDATRYCRTSFPVCVGNRMDMDELASSTASAGPGDNVIALEKAFMFTAGRVPMRTGSVDMLADCGENSLLSPCKVSAKMTATAKYTIDVLFYSPTPEQQEFVAIRLRMPVEN